MNNLRHLPKLAVFASVARHGSFTQAAHELGASKSAVSQQLKALEHDLGARLLNRTTRGVSPTALGEKLLTRCELLQEQLDMLLVDIVNAGVAPQGRFAVTFPHALAETVVLPAIEQLCTEYPGLLPELVASDQTVDLVAQRLDVAIHAGELPDSSYRALPVGTMTEVFCASPLYIHRNGLPKTLQDLAKLRWIATSWQQPKTQVISRKTGTHSSLTLNRFAQVNTLPTAVDMALRHLGMVLLPDVVAKPLLQSGRLLQLLDHVSGPHWPVHTLHAYAAEKPQHISRFHQLVKRYFGA
jgi:DNA-binding transcriptional LysR family regulator